MYLTHTLWAASSVKTKCKWGKSDNNHRTITSFQSEMIEENIFLKSVAGGQQYYTLIFILYSKMSEAIVHTAI